MIYDPVRHGVVAYADSLDCVGILTGNVASARTVFGESRRYATLGNLNAKLTRNIS